jgi:hypothetical protein
MRALLVIAALAFAPAVAAGQAPPDERAAAQALADAVERINEADSATEEGYSTDDDLDSRRCRRELFRIPVRREKYLRALVLAEELRHSADQLRDALATFRSDLASAVTRDPALISGRAAWRRLAKAYAALPPGGDLCADLVAWRRMGYDLATIRRAQVQYRAVFAAWGRGFQRKIAAAADRMRELGVSEEDAQRFEGDGD